MQIIKFAQLTNYWVDFKFKLIEKTHGKERQIK